MEQRNPNHGRRAFTVAVIGADGSGKTTVARQLIAGSGRPMTYVYLGPAIASSNHALPTTRLIAHLRRRALGGKPSASDPTTTLLPADQQKRLPRGRILKALGLINRIAEEWYRQLIVLYHHLRGRIVVCDRHFIYEYGVDVTDDSREILSVRIHNWVLRKFYPRPDLTLFLDAPVDLLYRRKPEWPIAFLEEQRHRIIEQGRVTPNFFDVDASAPLESVLETVEELIERFATGRSPRQQT